MKKIRLKFKISRSVQVVSLLVGWFLTTGLAGQTASPRPYIGAITGSEVRIRTGGSRNHHPFSTVKRGQRVIVNKEANGWCRIHIPRWIPVYVHKNYVTISPGSSNAIVKAGRLNVRVVPDRLHDTVGTLTSGSRVEVLGVEGDWMRIVPPPGAQAYISQKYVLKEREVSTIDVARELEFLTSVQASLPSDLPGSPRQSATVGLVPTTQDLLKAQRVIQATSTQSLENRSYAGARLIYKELIEMSEDQDEVAAAEKGLEKIKKLEERQAILRAANQSISDVENRNRELDERWRKARFSGRSGHGSVNSDAYLARGWLTGLGRFRGLQGTHRLMKGSQVLFFLKSEEGKAISFDAFRSKRVGVKGVVRELDPRFGANLIVVSEIVVLSDY